MLEEGAAIQACEARILRRNVVVDPGRPHRPGHGPGHPVRPQPDARTTCGPSTSTSTTCGPRCSSSGGSASGLSRLPLDVIDCPDRRLSRAVAGAGRRAGRRRDRGQHPAAPPLLRQGLAPDPPRPDRRPDRRGGEPALPRQCHHRALPGGTRDRAAEVLADLVAAPTRRSSGADRGHRPGRSDAGPGRARRRRRHSDRRARLAYPDPGRGPGEDPAGAALGPGPQSRVRAGRRQRARGHPGVPRDVGRSAASAAAPC